MTFELYNSKTTGRPKKPTAVKRDIEKKAESIMETFEGFTDGVRVLMLIWRSKDGAHKANNIHLEKKISRNSKEFKEKLIELLTYKDKSDLPLRIYSTVNPRAMYRAIREFREEQLSMEYSDDQSHQDFYIDVRNRFISALMSPGSRAEPYFLIDVDTPQAEAECLKKLAELDVRILNKFPTKNGWHIITAPFNHTLFNIEGAEVKKDAMLLLDY